MNSKNRQHFRRLVGHFRRLVGHFRKHSSLGPFLSKVREIEVSNDMDSSSVVIFSMLNSLQLKVDADSELAKDMKKVPNTYIELQLKFSHDYPFSPPKVFLLLSTFCSFLGPCRPTSNTRRICSPWWCHLYGATHQKRLVLSLHY